MKRILYWNEKDVFDRDKEGLNSKSLAKYTTTKFPAEKVDPDEERLPEWMQIRRQFSVDLPTFFGGGRLWFRRHEGSVMFQGRGWISDNIYWRSKNDPRVRYMIHAILEWPGKRSRTEKPTPHITLRNAETQAKIDLDKISPKARGEERVRGEMEVTRTSFSQGLGVHRKPGESMVRDDESFDNLRSAEVQKWLSDLVDAAQDALDREYKKEDESESVSPLLPPGPAAPVSDSVTQ